MEHRCGLRRSANVKTLIFRSGLPMAVGRLRNVSRHGLFITTDYENIEVNQLLEIEILGGRCGHHPHRRCRAMVTHRTELGFGLAIDDDCDVSVELVADLLAECVRREAAFSALNSVVVPIRPALRG